MRVLQISFSSKNQIYKMSASLEIKWNGKRFPVEFSSVKELEQTTVKELKQICERITGVNPRDMKINAFGGKQCFACGGSVSALTACDSLNEQ